MNRFRELDFIRAVSIVAVVVIHATIYVLKAGPSTVSSQIFCIAINQLSRFAVPSFLFVSGILAFQRFEKLNFREVLAKRFFELVVPYFIWSAIGQLLFPTTSIVQLGFTFVLGQGPFYQLYYVPLLFQMYLLLPFIKKAYSRALFASIFIVTVIIFLGYQALQLGYLPTPKYLPIQNLIQSTFAAWIIYFCLGYATGRNYNLFISKISKTPLPNIILVYIVSVIFLTLSFYLTWRAAGKLSGPLYDYYRFSILIYSFSSLLLLFKIGGRINSSLIDILYRNSFGIYLNHILVLIGLTKLTGGFLFTNIFTTLLGIIITLIISCSLNILLRRTIFSRLFLGQKPVFQNQLTRNL